MDKTNEFEIDRKLFAEFTHAISMRNILIEDLVDNRVGQELRAGRELTDAQFERLEQATHALKCDKEELAGMMDRMFHWSVEIAKAMNAAKELERDHRCNIDATDLEQGEYEPEEQDEPERTSSTMGDYSPGNPWNAPGMSISDFI